MNDSYLIIEKHSKVLRYTHWLNVPFTSLMIWSGWLIYWANPVYLPVPEVIGPFVIHHRLAEGMGWHFFIMWPFLLNGIAYLTYLTLSRTWKEILPDREAFMKAIPYLLYDLKISSSCPNYDGKYNPMQRIAYTSALLMAAGSVVSGLAIYKPVQLGSLTFLLGGYEAARLFHFLFMSGLIAFIFVHVFQVLRAGWNNFRAMVAGYELK